MDQTSQPHDAASDSGGPNTERHLDASEVERCAERLSVISERMLCFLKAQIDRLQIAAHNVDAFAEQISEYETKSLELEKRQENWERQKEREFKRMEEDARLLSQAWDRVEEERRECLTTGGVSDPSPVESPPSIAVEPQANVQKPPSLTDTDLFDLGVPTSTQTPAIQFQQMKREIRQHARRNR